jgi:hypothetical protein
MRIAPPLASPDSALALASCLQQSGWRLLEHRTRANGVGVSSAAVQEGASKRAAPPRSRPSPVIGRPQRRPRDDCIRPPEITRSGRRRVIGYARNAIAPPPPVRRSHPPALGSSPTTALGGHSMAREPATEPSAEASTAVRSNRLCVCKALFCTSPRAPCNRRAPGRSGSGRGRVGGALSVESSVRKQQSRPVIEATPGCCWQPGAAACIDRGCRLDYAASP